MHVKKMVIAGMLLGMSIPFVLLTDLYPFFRFGMFAEPVKRTIQTETFALRTIDSRGHYQYPAPVDLQLSSLTYLMRNYYYRGQTQQLLKQVHAIYPAKQGVRQWQLLKITSRSLTESKPDTLIAGQLLIK